MERIAEMSGGIRWTHIPFRGSAPNIQALVGGHIDCSAESSLWADLVRDNRLRLLATWGAERARRFPDAPTLRESGIDIVAPSPYGIAGPRGMDPEIARILHDAFKAALMDPTHLALIQRYDMSLEYLDGAGYAQFARDYYATDSVMVRRMGLRM